MADLHHEHNPTLVVDRVDEAVSTVSDPIPFASCQLRASLRSRVVSQCFSALNQVSTELPNADGLQFRQRRGFDEDFISCHSASSP